MKASLLSWYEGVRRDLPWRRTSDPYRVWISEVMLQQTRVETVVPYYERFLERFPRVEDLAAAAVEEVLAQWSGLGYYRRARQMHQAARQVVAAGGFPRLASDWRELPGVGEYTAAAVASIAFGEPVPVLDGNVERVLSRWLASAADPKQAANRARLRAAAQGFLDPDRPGDSNQALMELGATLCTPQRPRCADCPLVEGCRAAEAGEAERYPTPRRRRPSEIRALRVAVVRQDGRVLLMRRPEAEGLLAGTWELPWVEGTGGGDAAERLAMRYGGAWRVGPSLGAVRHTVTFRALRVEILAAELLPGLGVAEGAEAGWFDARQRRDLPLSALVEKVLRRAGET